MHTTTKFSIATYDRMIEAGVFEPVEENRLELIRGEMRDMSPIGPPHENTLDILTAWGTRVFPREQVRIRIQNSIGLPQNSSAPQPDFAAVRNRDYSSGRPTSADVLLLIEIAESSLKFDRTDKAELYAEAGIADYWIVNLSQKVVEVYRKPVAGRYQELRTYAVGESVAPLEFPEVRLDVASLWEGCAM